MKDNGKRTMVDVPFARSSPELGTSPFGRDSSYYPRTDSPPTHQVHARTAQMKQVLSIAEVMNMRAYTDTEKMRENNAKTRTHRTLFLILLL